MCVKNNLGFNASESISTEEHVFISFCYKVRIFFVFFFVFLPWLPGNSEINLISNYNYSHQAPNISFIFLYPFKFHFNSYFEKLFQIVFES